MKTYRRISVWLRTGVVLGALGWSVGVSTSGGVVLAGIGLAATTAALAQSVTGNVIADLLRPGQNKAAESEPFLEVDQAFVARPEIINSDTVIVRWNIADSYYLYRKRFQFRADNPPIEILSVELPTGELKQDEYFGQTEVYYRQVAARVELQPALTASRPVNLRVQYQGCADAGLCYPPVTKTFALLLTATALADSGDDATVSALGRVVTGGVGLSESDRMTRLLLEGSLWVVALSFFGFGLLLSLTPCMLPMFPILSSIVIGQNISQGSFNSGRALGLSGVFVLSMAVTYTAAGILAALFGANLSATLQTPWMLSVMAAVFVLLSLSLFGFYELRVPVAWQEGLTAINNRQRGGTWIGVAIMGLLSALIVGPCISAPLAAVLIVIGQTGNVSLGAIALFALGMGMGAPLLLVGTAVGKWLQRTGRWTVTIKAMFGVLLLGVAIVILERIVPGWVVLLLWAGLLIVSAIYMGALNAIVHGASGWYRLWKGVGLVMMIYGVILMLGAATGATDPLRPLQRLSIALDADESDRLQFRNVKGLAELQPKLQQAQSAQRPVILEYYADWCVSCKELERNIFNNAVVQQALREGEVVLLRADITADNAEDRALLKAYGLYGPPAVLFFDADGIELRSHRVIGTVSTDAFLRTVQQMTTTGASMAQPAAVLMSL